MTLQGLSSFCGSINLGGLRILEYVPIHWINASSYEIIRSSANNWQYAIPLLPGGSWLQMPLLFSRRNWSENGDVTEQGTRYEQLLNGVVPKLRPAASIEIEQMEQMFFLVRTTDRNGQPWLVGDLLAPLAFRAQADTADENGLNNYQIRFEGATKRRSAGYVPVY